MRSLCSDVRRLSRRFSGLITLPTCPSPWAPLHRPASNPTLSNGRLSLKDRIRRKLLFMTKIPTAVMPVDFMTKWIKREKMQEQLAYLVNAHHAVWPA